MVQKISNSNNVDEIEESIKRTLQKEISGEVRFDEITREIYSTDASIYRMLPLCVVIPKNTNDETFGNQYAIPDSKTSRI